eukprot:Opistho-2@91900
MSSLRLAFVLWLMTFASVAIFHERGGGSSGFACASPTTANPPEPPIKSGNRVLGCAGIGGTELHDWYVVYQFDLGSSVCFYTSTDAAFGFKPLCIPPSYSSLSSRLFTMKSNPLAQTIAQLFARDADGNHVDAFNPAIEHIVFDVDFTQLHGHVGRSQSAERLNYDFEYLREVQRPHGVFAYSGIAEEGLLIFHSDPYFPPLTTGPNGPKITPPFTGPEHKIEWDWVDRSIVEQYYMCVSVSKDSLESMVSGVAAMNPFVKANYTLPATSPAAVLGQFATRVQPFSDTVYALSAWPDYFHCLQAAGVDSNRNCLLTVHALPSVTLLTRMRAADQNVCVGSNPDGSSMTLDYSWGMRPWSSPGFMVALVGPQVARGFVCIGSLFLTPSLPSGEGQTAAALCIRSEALYNATLDAFNFVEAVCRGNDVAQFSTSRRSTESLTRMGPRRRGVTRRWTLADNTLFNDNTLLQPDNKEGTKNSRPYSDPPVDSPVGAGSHNPCPDGLFCDRNVRDYAFSKATASTSRNAGPTQGKSFETMLRQMREASESVMRRVRFSFQLKSRKEKKAAKERILEREYTPECWSRQFSHMGRHKTGPDGFTARLSGADKEEEFAMIQVRWPVDIKVYAAVEVYRQTDPNDEDTRALFAVFVVDGYRTGIASSTWPLYGEGDPDKSEFKKAYEEKHAVTFLYETFLAGRAVLSVHNLNTSNVYSAIVTLKAKPLDVQYRQLSWVEAIPPHNKPLTRNECMLGPCLFRVQQIKADGGELVGAVIEHVEFVDAMRKRGRATECKGEFACELMLETFEKECLEDFDNRETTAAEFAVQPREDAASLLQLRSSRDAGYGQSSNLAHLPLMDYLYRRRSVGIAKIRELYLGEDSGDIRDRVDLFEVSLCSRHLFDAAAINRLSQVNRKYVPVCHRFEPGREYTFHVGKDSNARRVTATFSGDIPTPDLKGICEDILEERTSAAAAKMGNRGLYFTLYDTDNHLAVFSAYSFEIPRTGSGNSYMRHPRTAPASSGGFMINDVLSGLADARAQIPGGSLSCENADIIGGIGIYGRGHLTEMTPAIEKRLAEISKASLMLLNTDFVPLRPYGLYDRGHLNPNGLNALFLDEGVDKLFAQSVATFSFLNVVPQNKKCNESPKLWKGCETMVMNAILAVVKHFRTKKKTQTVFVMTGTIPADGCDPPDSTGGASGGGASDAGGSGEAPQVPLSKSGRPCSVPVALWTEICAPTCFGAFRVQLTNSAACGVGTFDRNVQVMTACHEKWAGQRTAEDDEGKHLEACGNAVFNILKSGISAKQTADMMDVQCDKLRKGACERRFCKWEGNRCVDSDGDRCSEFTGDKYKCELRGCVVARDDGSCKSFFGFGVKGSKLGVTIVRFNNVVPFSMSVLQSQLETALGMSYQLVDTINQPKTSGTTKAMHRWELRKHILQFYLGAGIAYSCNMASEEDRTVGLCAAIATEDIVCHPVAAAPNACHQLATKKHASVGWLTVKKVFLDTFVPVAEKIIFESCSLTNKDDCAAALMQFLADPLNEAADPLNEAPTSSSATNFFSEEARKLAVQTAHTHIGHLQMHAGTIRTLENRKRKRIEAAGGESLPKKARMENSQDLKNVATEALEEPLCRCLLDIYEHKHPDESPSADLNASSDVDMADASGAAARVASDDGVSIDLDPTDEDA